LDLRVYAGEDDRRGTPRTIIGEELLFLVSAGEPVILEIAGSPLDPKVVRFSLKQADPVANDAFSNALDLGKFDQTIGFENYLRAGATSEPGEPLHGEQPTASRSIWWKWIPEATDEFRIDSDGEVSVYEGAEILSLMLITSGSDYVIFNADAEKTYRIAVASEDEQSLQKRLQIRNQYIQVTGIPSVDIGSAVDLGNGESVHFYSDVIVT
jgi:hypothetical protein